MSIFNGNASPFTEGNSLYEKNSISGMGDFLDIFKEGGALDLGPLWGEREKKEEKPFIGPQPMPSGDSSSFDLKNMKFTGGSKKNGDTPWWQSLLKTGMTAWGHYNTMEANKDKEKYNREKNRILEESYSNSVRVNANDAAPYLNTGQGMDTRPPVNYNPNSGWSNPSAGHFGKQQELERLRNEERQWERENRADGDNTKTILYVAGGGVALIAVLLVAMKVMK